jgi:hypothetical protein
MLPENRWRTELARLEDELRSIATRRVDISDPDWVTKLTRTKPLDEADVRPEAQALLLDILEHYAAATDAERRAIRALVDGHPSFAWAASPPAADSPAATLRLRLIHFALRDQGRDPRDAVLWLDDLCRTPGVPPEDLMALRREVGPMASNEDRYGFGSTRSMLLRGYGSYGRASAPERTS